ncbi:MAG TPA: hypothetical protein VK509_21540 [Polyangiales bacterium]|nr:hypothetical protein [Polyangiales bacterium]
MTLILTAFLGPALIVQVSDRRISYPRPRDPEDSHKKLISYEHPQARLVVAYTGLAEFVGARRRIPIEQWLSKTLASVPAASIGLAIKILTDGLNAQVERAKAEWNLNDSSAHLTVTLVGFSRSADRVLVCISNFQAFGTALRSARVGEQPFDQLAPRPVVPPYTAGNFTATIAPHTANRTLVVSHGNQSSLNRQIVNDLYRSIRHVAKRRFQPQVFRDVLVGVIRQAARRSLSVGDTCLSCILDGNAAFWEVGAHTPRGRDFSFPTTVMPGVWTRLWTITNEKDDAFTAARDQIARGELDVPLTQTSLRAYLDASEHIAVLALHLSKLGVEVLPPGLVERDCEMLGYAGIKSIRDVDELMIAARPWAAALLDESRSAAPQGAKRMFDVNGIVTTILIASNRQLFRKEILIEDFGYGDSDVLLDAAQRLVPERTG